MRIIFPADGQWREVLGHGCSTLSEVLPNWTPNPIVPLMSVSYEAIGKLISVVRQHEQFAQEMWESYAARRIVVEQSKDLPDGSYLLTSSNPFQEVSGPCRSGYVVVGGRMLEIIEFTEDPDDSSRATIKARQAKCWNES